MNKGSEIGVRQPRKKFVPRTSYVKTLPEVGKPYPELELARMRADGTYPDYLPVPVDLRPLCQGLSANINGKWTFYEPPIRRKPVKVEEKAA